MGRKTVFTNQIRNAILRSLRSGAMIGEACKAAGISRPTYYLWMSKAYSGDEQFIEFFEKVDKARAHVAHVLLKRIMEHSKKDWRAAAWWLEKYAPNQYGRFVGNTIPTENLTDDQLFESVMAMFDAVIEARRQEGKPLPEKTGTTKLLKKRND